MENLGAVADPSTLTCPDCGGALWELKHRRPLRYRCHTGHAFTAGSLQNLQAELSEHAMCSVRALQEREFLLRRLAMVSASTGDQPQHQAGLDQADQVRKQIDVLIELIEGADGA